MWTRDEYNDINFDLILQSIESLPVEKLFKFLQDHITDSKDPLLDKLQNIAMEIAEDIYPHSDWLDKRLEEL
jgi:hypothetical protein